MTVSSIRAQAARFFSSLVFAFLALILVLGTSLRADVPERAQLDKWRQELDAIEAILQRSTIKDDTLTALRDRVEPVRDGARALVEQLGPRIKETQLKLGILPEGEQQKPAEPKPEGQQPAADQQPAAGQQPATPAAPAAPPAAATPDPSPEYAADRQHLTDLENAHRQARVALTRAEALHTRISERRRDLLVSTVIARSSSLIDPGLWYDALASLQRVSFQFTLLAERWWSLLVERGLGPVLGALLIAIGLPIAFLGPLRRLLLRFRRREEPEPDLGEKALSALWITLVNAVIPTAALGIVFFAFHTFNLLPLPIESIMVSVVFGVGFSSLVAGLGRGLLAPARPNWRIAPIPDDAAIRLNLLASSVATVIAVSIIGGQFLGKTLIAPDAIISIWRGLTTVSIAVLIMLGLRTIATRLVAEEGSGLPFPWSLVVPASWLASVVAIVAGIFGFVMLGTFIIAQLLWTSTLLGILFLMLIVADDLFSRAFEAKTSVGVSLSRSLGLSGSKIEQLGVVVSGFVRLILITIAALLALAPYGIESGDVFGWLDTIFSGVTVGGITISVSAFAAAIGMFLIGIIATRGIQRWLDTQLLPRTRLDAGLRTSVRTGIGYAGVIAAAMIAFGSLGLNLSNIAIVAGALSVGIGFGLQSIVNNFVSGLILLAERPIRTGDWIVVGEEQGIVKKISVRATEIETFDRAAVIIPNSDLISGTVKNWVHADRSGRVRITLSVAYECDPEQIRALLMDCARSQPGVLIFPEPSVSLLNFGEAGLEFEVLCFVDDVNDMGRVRSDLLFGILARFREDKIEIPLRQNDVTISNADEIVAALKAISDVSAVPGDQKRRPRRAAVASDIELEKAD